MFFGAEALNFVVLVIQIPALLFDRALLKARMIIWLACLFVR
jgi:hypothetical protein